MSTSPFNKPSSSSARRAQKSIMPFKNLLSDIKSQVKDLQTQGQQLLQNRQQQPQPHQPPPVPKSTHPSYNHQAQSQGGPPGQQPLPPPPPQNPKIYWQPRFDPSVPVAQEWEQKTGNNNGWGNNEMEHYTAEGANSFCTPNNLLVLRAISSPSQPDPARKYTSARLVSHQRLTHPRGTLSAILTLPCAPGIWPAFWLLPHEPFTWPTDGEVDIAETWNGDAVNHSCLHWGFYSPEDKAKHRVIGTPVHDMPTGRPVKFEFAWDQDPQTRRGRMIWSIDGVAVMKAPIPPDMNRPMADFVVLLNVAMGGNVCQGRVPSEGSYDLVVHQMYMSEEPEGGWGRFESDWTRTREGDMI